MNKAERLVQAFNRLKSTGMFHTQIDAAKIVGCSRQNMSSALNGEERVLTDNFIRRFAEAFPQLSLDWLLTGEGEMLKDAKEEDALVPGDVSELPADANGNYRMVPVIHIDSVGGVHSQNDILAAEYVERYIPMTDAREGDVAIYQSGNSMAPAIPSGALLLIREVPYWREFIGYGDVFVMLLADERRITKEIRRYDPDPKNYYWCVSYNPDVADEELPKKFISRVWKVVKVLIDKGW